MRTTRDFLDEFKYEKYLRNDSELAKEWGVSRQLICHYKSGRTPLPEERVLLIAEVLKVDKADIYMSQAIERARRQDDEPLARSLADIAKRAGILATAFTLHAGSPAPSQAQTQQVEPNTHYAQWRPPRPPRRPKGGKRFLESQTALL